MKIFSKQKFMKDGKLIKKYKFCGITLLRKEKSPTKKKWNLLGVKVCKGNKIVILSSINYRENNMSSLNNKYNSTPHIDNIKTYIKEYDNIKKNVISLDDMKNVIKSDNIKVVSFDIFDTLLVRPVINPTDIWFLINEKLKQQYNLDFLKYRQNAEQELNNPFANINDIYNYIRDKYNLSSADIKLMKDEELHCEKQLLERREDIYELYNYAVSLGKKVIACSDMYLPSNFLKDVLLKNGYTKIEKVYVSNEFKARKDTGKLYDILTEKEKTNKILHIGDNYNSDYLAAIKQGITAIYYPAIKNIILSEKSIYNNIWVKGISPDPICRILLGYTLNGYFKNLTNISNNPSIIPDFKSFIKLCIAPVIFYIANSIANNKSIQSSYKQILFASRDGYLPKLGYDVLLQYRKGLLPSKYVYAGRRAYFPYVCNDFLSYVKNLLVDGQYPYTLEDLLNAHIYDNKLKQDILKSISENDKKLTLQKNRGEIIDILTTFSTKIEKYIKIQKKEIQCYYNCFKSNNSREIIFDCGYSGSISVALTQIMGKPVDKIYLWQKQKNQSLDLINNTNTFILMHENNLFPHHNVMYEEIFSPLEGGCIGFKNKKPIIENISFSNIMTNNYTEMQNYIIQYMKNICTTFSDYLQYMQIYDTYALQSILRFAITQSPYNEVTIFSDVIFPDTIFTSTTRPLSVKIEEIQNYKNVFERTGFDNPQNKLTVKPFLHPNNMKIGLHCHLYNIHLYEELLGYLKDFPQKFDLIITICDDKYKNILENVFNNKTIVNLNKLIIMNVPNRGRDVAPWLVGTKNMQKQYDLFCHIHGKESKHIGFGDKWRKYLYANLLEKNAIINIINSFSLDDKLGCIFPEIFPQLKQMCIEHNIEQTGMFGEIKIIDKLVSRMQIEHQFTRNEMYFSEGTMMWYRPKALEKLFTLNLQYTDFPEEPIGVGGTIAHAIERLPAFVTRASGYDAKIYNIK